MGAERAVHRQRRGTTRALARLCATGLVALTGSAAVAEAVGPRQHLSVTLARRQAGTPSRPRDVGRVTVDLSIAAGRGGFATRTVVVLFDENLVFNAGRFPSCTARQAQRAARACRPARVGGGRATGVATRTGGRRLTQRLTIAAFNGPRGRSLLLRVQGRRPLPIAAVLVGRLVRASGPYGARLVVRIPRRLQQPLPGTYAALTRFVTSVGGVRDGVPYVGLAGCPASHRLRFAGRFAFTDGTTQTPSATARCTS